MKKPISPFKNCLTRTYFLSLMIFYSHFLVSNATEISYYSDHCSSVVQEATSTLQPFPSFPLGHPQTAYRGGDNGIFGWRSSNFLYSFTFQAKSAYSTDFKAVIRVEAVLEFPRPHFCNYERSITGGKENCSGFPRSVMQNTPFWLEGFWSETSGKLCMIGSRSFRKGDFLDLIVLKLENVRNSSAITSLITGTLEILSSGNDSNQFEPISILMIPGMNYEYSLVDTEFQGRKNKGDGGKSLPFRFPESICNRYGWSDFEFSLKYSKNCDSWKNCSPFPGAFEDLPLVASIHGFECSREKPRMLVLLSFSKTSSGSSHPLLYPKKTLIGEGFWDERRIYIVACRFLDVTETIFNSRVADCSTRLSLWLPAKLSIRETRSVVGQIWSTKTVNDSGYFSRIRLEQTKDLMVGIPVEYEYTEIDEIRSSCLQRQSDGSGEKIYPNRKSFDLIFDMTVRNGMQRIARGYAAPFSISDEYFYLGPTVYYYREPKHPNSEITANFQNSKLVNISYKVEINVLPDARLLKSNSLFSSSSIFHEKVEICAEGIYNEEIGHLCMIGCRNLGIIVETDEVDCKILVKFQFPPLQGNDSEGYIKGSIESTRKSSDPLYFEPLEVCSSAYTGIQAGKHIRRINREIAMSLVSSTLSCIFIGLQHLYVKGHPEVLPSISFAAMSVLSLGHIIHLVRNLDVSRLENIDLINQFLGYESLEVYGVIIGIVRMVAFSMQIRLVQRIWSARSSAEGKHLWSAEIAATILSVPLFVAGALSVMHRGWSIKSNLNLTSCTEFFVNGFLLPQILLNIVRDSEDKALYDFFYIGTTSLQLLPHASNLNRAYIYIIRFSIIYTDASMWDVFISLWSVLLAAVIFLQQKFGGGFMLPQRFRDH